MPVDLPDILDAYRAGAAAHRNGKALAADAARRWSSARDPARERVGSVELRDSARRQWTVDVRRDRRGRWLELRPSGADLERFRASADGHLPEEWLPIAEPEWLAFALLAAGEAGGAAGDEELGRAVSRLLDRMVREAQHHGLAFDEDED